MLALLPSVRDRLILDLCGGTGSWSRPYAQAGYPVTVVDPLANGCDVRLMPRLDAPVWGILAAPPCTHLSGSGARWWKGKGEAALIEALAVVDACLRIVMVHRPRWWVLENPVGRLTRYLGAAGRVVPAVGIRRPLYEADLPVGRVRHPAKAPGRAGRGRQDMAHGPVAGSLAAPQRDATRIRNRIHGCQPMTIPALLVPADLQSHTPRSYEQAVIDRAERLYQRHNTLTWPYPRLFVSIADDGQLRETAAGRDLGSVIDLATERGYQGTIVLEAGKPPRIVDLSDHAHACEAERKAEDAAERKYGIKPGISRGMS